MEGAVRSPAVSRPLQVATQITLLAALYFVVAKVSLLTAIPPGYATPAWPPSGLALAAVLVFGPRIAPGIWIGAAVVNLTVQSSLVAAVLIGTGNSLEALVGAALIRHYIGVPRRFQRGEDVFAFVALAAVASAVAATIGSLSIASLDAITWSELPANWWTWWQGDTSGIIVVTPLLLTLTAGAAEPWTRTRKLELGAFAVVLAASGYLAFGGAIAALAFSPLLLVLILPLVIWAAFRFDQREVTIAIAALCAAAVGFTIAGRGPLASISVDASLLRLLIFISVVAVTGLSISAVVGERRRAMRALHRSRDELERRVLERTHALRRGEETFRLLVEGIQDYAIFMLDPDGHVVSWNRGAEKITRYTSDEIVGRHVSHFYARDDAARHLHARDLALARTQGRFETEAWRLRKDGSRFWASVIINALHDPDGRLRGFATITRDMTERKRIEALEHGERRMNEFLAMLGHELRNPLAPIKNALQLMRMKSAGDSTQEWSRNVIDRQVTQLTRLVDDLLDVGRITSGKIALKKEPVELNAAVLRAVEACRASAEAHAQALDVHRAEESLLINGDLIRLSQIVLNLLSNAIKYTPDGGRIQVDVARDGEWAVVRISDTGIGITAELLPSVFDLFVQGERSLARTEGGLGIGLTVVRQLVALHGGTVAARSDGPGRGSEFTVLLPVLTHPPLVRGLDAHWEARAPRVVRRVLVVDDNRDSADMMSALLRTWGHEVRTMYNGPAALASAAEHRPDIVLLDIGLPGMDGYAVARELRARGQGGALLLIAFTGYGQDEDRLRVRKAGFDHHLVKPVDPAELEAIIEAMPAPTPSSQDVVESGGKRQ